MSGGADIGLRRRVSLALQAAYSNVVPYTRMKDRWDGMAQAALDACQAEEMRQALIAAHAHVQELRDAWQRGAISEHDGLGGTRSNRNVDVEVQLRSLLAKMEHGL